MDELKKYLKYDYPITIIRYPDGIYCAEIKMLEGLCAYGSTPQEALNQLEDVKETAFELIFSQGKKPLVPTVQLEIPVDIFSRIHNRSKLNRFVKT